MLWKELELQKIQTQKGLEIIQNRLDREVETREKLEKHNKQIAKEHAALKVELNKLLSLC